MTAATPYVSEKFAAYIYAVGHAKKWSSEMQCRMFVVSHGPAEFEVTNEPPERGAILVEYDCGYGVKRRPEDDEGRRSWLDGE